MDPYAITKDAIEVLRTVYEKCKEFREADRTITDTKACLDAVEVRLELFEECLKHTRSDLTDRQRKILQNTVEKVSDTLKELGEKLPEKPTIATKMTWVGWGKRRAERLIEELKQWDRDTQGTFFMLDLVKRLREGGAQDVDEMRKRLFDTGDRAFAGAWALSNRIFSLDTDDQSHTSLHFPKSSVTLPSRQGDQMICTRHGSPVYLEAHYIDEGDEQHKQTQISSVDRLAYVFNSSDVDFSPLHLLRCSGVVEDYEFDRCYTVYDLPFQPPVSSALPTLSRTLDKQARITLEDRFGIAVGVATAVFSIHAAGWVHKNIRSENIFVDIAVDDKDPKATAVVGSAYLIGFQAIRPRVEGSEQRPEMDPIKRLYQHPDRQGGRDTRVVKFDIRHDMYSLGAVLVEIGYRKTLREIFQVRSSSNEPSLDEARKNHQKLINYAQRLTDKMGTRYADAALVCLKTSVKETSPDRLREEFYESVLRPLQYIHDGLSGRKQA